MGTLPIVSSKQIIGGTCPPVPQVSAHINVGLPLKFSRNKRKRQPIGMLGRSSGNHDWLLANTSDCV